MRKSNGRSRRAIRLLARWPTSLRSVFMTYPFQQARKVTGWHAEAALGQFLCDEEETGKTAFFSDASGNRKEFLLRIEGQIAFELAHGRTPGRPGCMPPSRDLRHI